jgi:methylated-DNA-[protein]-cysteine S-methyltransferase
MAEAGIASFSTALGDCAVAWRDDRIVGVQLPEAEANATLRRLSGRFPMITVGEPPIAVRLAIAGMQAMLRGECVDLAAVPVAFAAHAAFDQEVYRQARTIPFGRVVTYGAIAQSIGDPGASREVGAALGRNPVPLLVPCHRVVAAGGRLGGFSAAGGTVTKRRLIDIERARPDTGPDLFD